MENDDQKHKLKFHHNPDANQMQEIHDAATRENLSNILQNLASMRRIHETSLKSVSEERFTTSCAETLATMSSSEETTGGGNEMLTSEDKNESLVSSPMMM